MSTEHYLTSREKLHFTIRHLKQENEKLKKCVEFYGDENNYHDGIIIKNDDRWIEDEGKIARQTLKELSDTGNTNES